jgi:hypothetical protein
MRDYGKSHGLQAVEKGPHRKGFSPGPPAPSRSQRLSSHRDSQLAPPQLVSKKENVIQSEASESLRRFGAKQLKPESKDLRLGRTYKFGSGMRISSRVSGTTVEATAFRPWEKAR